MPSIPDTDPDPLAPLAALPGVAEAVSRARDAVGRVHRHPANRLGWPATAAEANVRAARASAALDGGDSAVPGDGVVTDPVLAGALRVGEELGRLLPVWRRTPLQALARLHMLAAADVVSPASAATVLGRPRTAPGVASRLELLSTLLVSSLASARVPAPVLFAVVHGELLALAPFTSGNGVVARAAARLTGIASGLDPRGLVIPEVGHLRRQAEYRSAAQGFAEGTESGLANWLVHSCAAWEAGAREAESIARAATP